MTAVGKSRSAAQTEHDVVRRIVQLGCRAPSVHNTQPWRWRIEGGRIELRADRGRQLAVSDPDGRNLTLSCGAALHHVQVAAAGLGRHALVEPVPDPREPDLLAVIDVSESRVATPADLDLLDALDRRVTDRRRFTSWPVPEERLEEIASAAHLWGARVLPLTGTAARAIVERLVNEALDAQRLDPRFAAEQQRWIARSTVDGLPPSALPEQTHPAERRDRFDRRVDPVPSRAVVEGSDGVLVICTAHDTPRAWLAAGEALSAVWLRATQAGFSVVPLSQVIEVDKTRSTLLREVFFDMAQPQLLLRIGWQEVTRSPMPRTPRRPLDDVLD
jgi:hypothetical protein